MKKMFFRIVGLILTAATVWGASYTSVYALTDELSGTSEAVQSEQTTDPGTYAIDGTEYEAVPYIIGENEGLRGENEKHFRMSDGTTIAAVYSMPVHYLDGDEWKEPDATLVLGIDGYIPRAGISGVNFSSDKLSDELFTFNSGEHSVSMSVYDGEQTGAVIELPVMPDEDEAFSLNNFSTAYPEVSERTITLFDSPEDFAEEIASTALVLEEYEKAHPEAGKDELLGVAEAQNEINKRQQDEIMNSPYSAGNIRYDGMIDGASLEYSVTMNSIKESIIVSEPSDSYVYRFVLDTGLSAVFGEEGEILLCDDGGETIFAIPAPYMIDADGEKSFDVTYSLDTINGKTVLTVEADAEWIEAEGRAFPVAIDPTLTKHEYNNEVLLDAYVTENGGGGYNTGTMYTGYSSYLVDGSPVGRQIIYIKISNFPTVPDSAIIVGADISLYQHMTNGYLYVGTSAASTTLAAYEVAGAWDETITWVNSPYYYDVVDYVTTSAANNNNWLTWDVTRLARNWYNGGTNNGIAIVPYPEYTSSSSAYASICLVSENHGSYYEGAAPYVRVSYRDNKGVEDYWTAQTQAVGQYNIGYVGDYNSQLTLIHNDIVYDSEVLPFTLSHVYNSAYRGKVTKSTAYPYLADNTNMFLGNGWKLNVMETLVPATIDGASYMVHNDADGTDHYYYLSPEETNTYKSEDGLELTVTRQATEDRMTDKKGNRKVFINGTLSYILYTNGNKLIMSYNTDSPGTAAWTPTGTDDRLEAILHYDSATDSYITIANLVYGSSGDITYLAYMEMRNGDQVIYYYDLNSGILQNSVHYYTGGGTTQFAYDRGVLTQVYDAESQYGIVYTYSGNRITGISEFSGTMLSKNYGQKVYINNNLLDRTEYTYEGKEYKNVYLFDYFGRTVNVHTVYDDTIYGASMGVYSDSGTETKNKLSSTASTGIPSVNRLVNPGFEDAATASYWVASGATAVRSSEEARTGAYSQKITVASPTGVGCYQQVNLTQGTEYTFSAYVKLGSGYNPTSNGGAYLWVGASGATAASSEKITSCAGAEDGWRRISVTFTAPVTYSFNLSLYAIGIGDVYFDDVQLVEGKGGGSVNLLSNSSIESGVSGWYSDYISATSEEKLFGSYSMKTVGTPASGNWTYQYVPIDRSSNETYVLSGWAKATSVSIPSEEAGRSFRLRAEIYYSDGTAEMHNLNFNPQVTEWQFASMPIVPKKNDLTVTHIYVYANYGYNANTAYFDGISLSRDPAQTYKYDENGNVVASGSTAQGLSDMEYDSEGINLIKLTAPGSGSYDFTYDSSNNLTQVTSSAGIYQKIIRAHRGLATESQLLDEGGTIMMQSTVTYADSGNVVSAVQDSGGLTTTYTYDEFYDKLLSTTSKGQTVSYSYTGEQLTGLSAPDLASVAYTYTKGYLTDITRTSATDSTAAQTYTLVYDGFGNLTQVKYGGSTLITYTYQANNGNLSRIDYANGSAFVYQYDELDRLDEIGDKNCQVYLCSYDAGGRITSVTDRYGLGTNDNARLYEYEYDSLGCVLTETVYEQSGTSKTHLQTIRYAYDAEGRVSKTSYGSDVAVDMSYVPTYNDNGELTELNVDSSDGEDLKIEYTYDSLRRTMAKTVYPNTSGEDSYKIEYVYKNIAYNRTTTYLMQVKHYINNELQYYFYYDYDDNWNINYASRGFADGSAIVDATYTYDENGQLASEYLPALGKTYYYDYDSFGNITQVSFRNDGETVRMTDKNFAYGDTSQRDKLTTVGNFYNITYDAVGNPIKYYNVDSEDEPTEYDLTWIDGRRLASCRVDGGTPITFTYNKDGVRTSKGSIKYILDGSTVIAEERTDNNITYLLDENGSYIGFIDHTLFTSDKYYYVKNQQGDVVQLLNESMEVVANYSYNAWGRILSVTDASGNAVTGVNHPGNMNPIRYRGYYYDTETGFYYCGSRYYDPESCRFISLDNTDVLTASPMAMTDKNLYAYCDNNPVMRVDHGGQFWDTIFDVISLASSVVEVCINPTDPWAWAGLAGDAIDLIPFVTGVGEVTRAVKTVDKVADTVQIAKAVDFTEDAADIVKTLDRSSGFTKSTASAGRKIHDGYKVGDGFNFDWKEYKDIKGIRPDYIDFDNKIIYELKPMNPRSARSGIRQLQRYNKALGGGFTMRLELY